MKVDQEKILMSEAAILYYEKKMTQQEIAEHMKLSRQTVSRLLTDAVNEKIVEIKIHNPQKDCEELEAALCDKFGIRHCLVCGIGSKNESLRYWMTIRAATDYLAPLLAKGHQKIALSWGRTVQDLIATMPQMTTVGNTVFPLFGATDHEHAYFSSNELARGMAEKIGAKVTYAWFPYRIDHAEDCILLKKLSYYQTVKALWQTADTAIVGIGHTEILDIFEKTFGYSQNRSQVIGDIATHFFNENGKILPLYENRLCASFDDLQNIRQIIAIACGDNKIQAIRGALRTHVIHTLITDEHTARKVLRQSPRNP